jgi:hypothetical protein
VADVALAAAVRAQADAVYIEPRPAAAAAYAITLERGSQVISTSLIDASIVAAVIAADPWSEAAALGLTGLTAALESPS